MIRRRTVIVLAAAALVTSAAAVVAVVDRGAETRTEVEAVPLYPGLQERAGEVQQVRISRAADSKPGTATLLRTESGWVLKERDLFPGRTDLVRKLLFDLGELVVIERKTADPGRYDRLDLGDVGKAGSHASRIEVTTAGGETLVDLHVGKKRESLTGGKPMVYVRRSDQAQAYLAEGELELRVGPVEWLSQRVLNIPKATIVAAILTDATGAQLQLERAGEDFRIVDLPAGRKIDSQYSVNNAATVIDRLVFDDVRAAEGLDFDAGQAGGLFVTNDGLTITLDLAADPTSADALPWVRVGVAIADDASEEARTRGETAKAETAGWAFRLSSYNLERLRATVQSLTKPAEGT